MFDHAVLENVKVAVKVVVVVLALQIVHKELISLRAVHQVAYEFWLAGWHGEEHHVHRDEGLPAGVQILLPRGQEHKGAYDMGGGKGGYRLHT